LPSGIPSTPNAGRGLWPLWAILACAAVLRLVDALRRPLQVDEAYSLHLAALPLAQGMRAVATLDIHPPLFLIVSHALAAIHLPDRGFRVLAALLGVVSVWLCFHVVRAWHGEPAASIAAGLAAFMPSMVFYDTMIRMYAPFDALALATFLALSILYTREDLKPASRRLWWCAWALLCAACIATLYLGFFVIAAQLAYTAIFRRDAGVKAASGAAAAIVLWLPQLPTFIAQLPRGGLAFPFYAQHELATILELPGQATLAPQTIGAGTGPILVAIFVWLWIVCALAFGLRGQARSLGLWLAAPGVLTLAYSLAAHKLLYTDRYYLLSAYALCCLSALAFVRLFEHRPQAARVAGASFAAVVVVAGCAYAFDPHLYTADWPAVGAVLQANVHAGDLVVMEQGSSFFPLERGPWLDHDPLLLVFHERDVAGAVRLARPYQRVFLVVFQAGPVDPSLALLAGLQHERRPIYLWSFVRGLPAESASVLVFVKRSTTR
jgi:uncharacterized membrane protein